MARWCGAYLLPCAVLPHIGWLDQAGGENEKCSDGSVQSVCCICYQFNVMTLVGIYIHELSCEIIIDQFMMTFIILQDYAGRNYTT